jgi:hypothetical protein
LIFPDSPPPLDSFDPVAVEDLSEAPLVDVDGEGAAVEPDEQPLGARLVADEIGRASWRERV